MMFTSMIILDGEKDSSGGDVTEELNNSFNPTFFSTPNESNRGDGSGQTGEGSRSDIVR